MGKAEDAVERRADLVAHVGQELGFDPAGLQRFLTCQVQLDVLDLDGLEVLLYVFGGLVDALLQFFTSGQQGFGHTIDARRHFVHFMAAERWQTSLQVTVLELRHSHLDPVQRLADRGTHAQRQQRSDDQPGANQQQAGK